MRIAAGDEYPASRLGLFIPWVIAHITHRRSGSQNRSGHNGEEKNISLLGSRTRFIRSCSHHTNRAISVYKYFLRYKQWCVSEVADCNIKYMKHRTNMEWQHSKCRQHLVRRLPADVGKCRSAATLLPSQSPWWQSLSRPSPASPYRTRAAPPATLYLERESRKLHHRQPMVQTIHVKSIYFTNQGTSHLV
jgi:hypothetical protein